MVSFWEKIGLALGFILIISGVFAVIWCDNGLVKLSRLEQKKQKLIENIQIISADNRNMHRKIERLKSDINYIEHIAKHELGMIKKNEIIFKIQEKPAEKIKPPSLYKR